MRIAAITPRMGARAGDERNPAQSMRDWPALDRGESLSIAPPLGASMTLPPGRPKLPASDVAPPAAMSARLPFGPWAFAAGRGPGTVGTRIVDVARLDVPPPSRSTPAILAITSSFTTSGSEGCAGAASAAGASVAGAGAGAPPPGSAPFAAFARGRAALLPTCAAASVLPPGGFVASGTGVPTPRFASGVAPGVAVGCTAVAVAVAVAVGAGVCVAAGVAVGFAVAVAVGVLVGVAVAVGTGVLAGMAVAVGTGMVVGESVGVAVGASVGASVGVGGTVVGTGVGTGVGVGGTAVGGGGDGVGDAGATVGGLPRDGGGGITVGGTVGVGATVDEEVGTAATVGAEVAVLAAEDVTVDVFIGVFAGAPGAGVAASAGIAPRQMHPHKSPPPRPTRIHGSRRPFMRYAC